GQVFLFLNKALWDLTAYKFLMLSFPYLLSV
ncbi:MAG: hypothetical protein ACI976_001172, partial [Aureispira sp.]